MLDILKKYQSIQHQRRRLRARIFAIACGYEDADDLDRLRSDPALKLACGRLPDTGRDLCRVLRRQGAAKHKRR
jgi:Transposase DDE domain group 1